MTEGSYCLPQRKQVRVETIRRILQYTSCAVDNQALVRQLLEWIAERPRTYQETMDAWRTNCPRLSVWEDAIDAGLVEVEGTTVRITGLGRSMVLPTELSPTSKRS